jgi:phosphatidylethanolamine/phosphatidyl-N-methylethanolamine N-methyltransferase
MDAESLDRAYSFYSNFYDVIWHKLFHESREEAVALLNLQGGERVLDVGVGTGLSLSFYPKNCTVVGIDLCDAMLKKGRQRLAHSGDSHIELLEMDAMNMAFHDNSFDAIFAAYTISAVPDPSTVLDEMIRVCKTGGKLAFVNHFQNGNPFIAMLEKLITPLTKKTGFRADLHLETLFAGKPIVIEKRISVKPLNYWDLVLCTNKK